jgi:hypothetical protein
MDSGARSGRGGSLLEFGDRADRARAGRSRGGQRAGFTIPQVLGFNARRQADGSASGHINYRQTFEGETFHFVATVTCTAVYDGNRVKCGGVLTRSTDPTVPVGDFMWFQSIDNGEGEGAAPDLSTGSGFGTEAENQAFCDSPAPPDPIFLAEVIGNIQVRE